MTQDKVDFVLPPWSTGFNIAVGPFYALHGYPQLAVTANTNDETPSVPTSAALAQYAALLRRTIALG